MTKRRPSNPRAPLASPFRIELERALEHFNDAAWLAGNSPLAAPYLLGSDLLAEPNPLSAQARGRVLQQALKAAAADLKPDADRRYDPARLLQLTFFSQNRSLNQAGIALKLGLSPATFYRHRLDSLSALEEAFALRVQPVQRLESPQRPQRLVGRERALAGGVASLCQAQCVAISGGSGLGKTSLGAALARNWQAEMRAVARTGAQPPGVFWFTFRPGISDHVSSLLFSLGYFFHKKGVSALWLQMVASNGRLAHEVALNLTRECLNSLPGAMLIVFDECDLLIPSDATTEHIVQLRSFVEALVQTPRHDRRDLIPVLLVGQALMLEPDSHIVLNGLAADDAQDLLLSNGINLGETEFSRLLEFTRGNPLMLNLFIALREGSGSNGEALHQLGSTPTAGLLFSRVWRRLSAAQREVLALIAVFRGAAPRDAVQDTTVTGALVDRAIIVEDGLGGIALPASLREPALRVLDVETRQTMHLRAAELLARRADVTESAYHFAAAGRPEMAVHVWYGSRAREIARGNGIQALEVFRGIARDSLAAVDRKVLALIRAELHALVGEADAALDEVRAARWTLQDPLSPEARQFEGDSLRMLGQQDAAVAAYREGLKSIEAISNVLASKSARLHASVADALLQSGSLDEAWRSALHARFISEISQGSTLELRGVFHLAEKHYAAAMNTAHEAGVDAQVALAQFNLANLAVRTGQFDLALRNYQGATETYQRIGDQVYLNRCHTSLAAMHIQRGDFKQAVKYSIQALQFFEQVGHVPWAATNASNLAEAQFGLGDLDAAEHSAMRALNHEDETNRPYALTVLGNIALARNQPGRAESTLRDAISQAQATKDRWAEAPAWRALANALRALNRETEAAAALETAIQLFTELGLQNEVERTRATTN